MPSTPALSLTDIEKRYGPKRAVAGISLDVVPGSTFGLVGPNGAGKTTLLSTAVGLLRPDRGRVHVRGVDLWHDPVEAKSNLGSLLDVEAVPDRLTGLELLTYLGRLRGLPRRQVAHRAHDLLDVLDLAEAGNTLIVEYSTGMRKKICLAAALLHTPPLLVLDEPLEAVDPVSSAAIRSILRSYTESGGTIVLSSHVVSLVEDLCTHVAVVVDGEVAMHGEVDELRDGSASLEVRLVRAMTDRPDDDVRLPWLRPSYG
jgi:ABC-2 type transport system ATP-binding protein